MTSLQFRKPYLVQFWAPKVDGRGRYLTTSDQPFALVWDGCMTSTGGHFHKGLCWYRKHSANHLYLVKEGAQEEELGSIGRVYRNMHPESSPDLRLYSTKEFPLRDHAARCGLRTYLALPIFDSLKEKCYGALEFLSIDHGVWENENELTRGDYFNLEEGLKAANLRSTHIDFSIYESRRAMANSDITEMLELAIKAVPQLHMAQVWVPCKQCANTSTNLSCMERATSRITTTQDIYDHDMLEYLLACEFHNLLIGKGITRTLMSSNNKCCFCRNICDFNISENPLAHYAQKARLSFCFAICIESVHNSNDLYVVEFFLQPNSREDACGGSLVHLLLRIMEMKLKNFKFASGGQLGEELVVELSQPYALGYESIKYVQERKHQHSEEINMLMGMKGYRERYSLSDFTKCLLKTDLSSKECGDAWLFWSPMREELSENEVNSNSLLQEKIKLCMSQITIHLLWEDYYSLVQFWTPKMNEDSHRCYLATSGQPFTLNCLHKGLALFRKQCMEHHYFVDEGAKEEELGPPGRVFRNGHFEFTHDVRLYSAREFPLRNQAARCFLRNYLALPVFDLQQHNCVGVLEVFSLELLNHEAVGKALETANLSSTHTRLQPSFRQNAAECQKQALTEIMEALELVTMIPQLYLAEVWVPCSQCISNNVSCVELALSTYDEWEFLRSMYKFNHVQTGKGIVGMLLASENKSCFCRNSCDFSIAEEPLAHYAQVVRLDVCFAICLQSSHTGNLLYVLKFFLNQGPGKREYLPSFLNSLLQIMKQQLKSFKVASGQQLGEELVVEVIEFSEGNELTFSELDQPDIFPIKFKNVQYSQKKHQHSKDQQLHFVPNDMDSVRSVVARANLKKQDATKKTEGGKRKTSLHLSREVLEPHFGKKLKDAAKDLHVGRSTIKRACRDCGIHRWPCDRKYKNNPSLFQTESGNQHVQILSRVCAHLTAATFHRRICLSTKMCHILILKALNISLFSRRLIW